MTMVVDRPIVLTERLHGLLELVCKHGVGHPSLAWLALYDPDGNKYLGVHACDGCCLTKEWRNRDYIMSSSWIISKRELRMRSENKNSVAFVGVDLDIKKANRYGIDRQTFAKLRSLMFQACLIRAKNKCERCGIHLGTIPSVIALVAPATNVAFAFEADWNNVQCEACYNKFGRELSDTRNKVALEMVKQFGSTPTTYKQPHTIIESDLLERIESYAKEAKV